jgi:hypothetical protein
MAIKVVRSRIDAGLDMRSRSGFGAWTPWAENSGIHRNIDTTVTTEANLADYKSNIRKKITATTQLTADGYESERGGYGTVSYGLEHKTDASINRYREYRGYGGGAHTDLSNFAGLDTSRVRTMVLQQFISKADRELRALQGLVTLGELGETLRLIRHPLRQLRGSLDDYLETVRNRTRGLSRIPKRRRLPGARRVISDTWLEYSFGMLPLVSDIRGSCKGLAEYLNYREPTKRIDATAQNRNIISRSYVDNPFFGYNIRMHKLAYGKYAEHMYGAVVCRTGGTIGSLQQLFGFRLEDVVPSVYELIPWSFMVDYFSNTGAIISSFAFNRANLAWVNMGQKSESTVEQWAEEFYNSKVAGPFDSNPANWRSFKNGSFSTAPLRLSRVQKVRSVYSGSLIPSFEFRIPGMSTKWLNISALVASSRSTSSALRRLLS